MELSVILPAINEAENLSRLIPRIREVASGIGSHEIIVIDGGSTDGTASRAASLGALVHAQAEPGYGGALKEAFRLAQGDCVVTLDADYSHDPTFIRDLWDARGRGAVVIASRYVPGGASEVSGLRSILSRILNLVFRRVLSIPLRDMSSGFRLYHRAALREVRITSRHFDALEEILIKLVGLGHAVAEIPFTYRARGTGVSKARIVKFGLQLTRTLHRLWQLRNGAGWCDYDHRAYDSPIFLQRYWQHRRHRIILGWHRPGRTLDVGCGSSRILEDLGDAVGMDISMPKLRFMSRRGCRTVQGSVFTLPFRDGTFDEAVFSQVIEHIPSTPRTMSEVRRVLRPGGRLIIGTPDYSRLFWWVLEWFYGKLRPEAYAHEHISRYTLRSMRRLLAGNGFEHRRSRYVGGAELIQLALKGRDPAGGSTGGSPARLSIPLILHRGRLARGRALQAGAGNGEDAPLLALAGWRVTLLDPSGEALDRALRRARELRADVSPVRGDLRHPSLRGPFETIVLTRPFETADAPLLVRLLAPGGTLFVGIPDGDLPGAGPGPWARIFADLETVLDAREGDRAVFIGRKRP